MARARICVVGSANMDLVVFAERSPSLGETVSGSRFVTIPGGKGANQAIAAARAGGSVRMVGAVGDDTHGDQIVEVMESAGVETTGVSRELDVSTGTAHILVEASGDNSIVVVPGANASVEPTSHQLAGLNGAQYVLLQLELPLAAVEKAAVTARSRGVKVVLTPAPAQDLPASLLDAVDILVPNEHEARVLAAQHDVMSAGIELLEKVPDVVVTMGSRGSLWLSRSGAREHVPARSTKAVDTTAAGDTFVGALAVALGEGKPMREALEWATAAAALSVEREGASTSMPTRDEITAALA
ncbi:ribokinase [Tenggerimyces flavus]|uniref:Ribokinase n=1 Tax=Tenggerimyces flavus TaxID=1708749 RepID=A0ABV7YF01_9ACTN|nr:ribokinase [Tenggerimyces flavus]